MNTNFNNNNGSQDNNEQFTNQNINQQSESTQQNYSQGQTHQQYEQPRQTPFQTPVHGSDEQINFNNNQTNSSNAPFGQNTHSYKTYEQWQMHNVADMKKKRRKFGKKPAIAVGSIALAAAIFAGGIAIGSNGFSNQTYANTVNKNLPTLTISNTPQDNSTAETGKPLSGKQIFEKVNPSIVAIQSMDATGQVVSSGSGVIMSSDGYIITNAHVITDENTSQTMQSISVLFSDGSQLMANVVGSDVQTDLAVIKVTPKDKLIPAEFGNSDNLQVGEDAYAIGSPGGIQLANTMTNGIISAINRDITVNDRVMSLIQTNVTINPGNSGGALINQYGQVIGITSAKLGISYYEGLGFAIPINSAKEIVDELITNGYIQGRPSIGIRGKDISAQIAQFRNLPVGVQINSVDSRAKAASEGLFPGDVITAVNGKTIQTMEEINAIKEDMKAGDKLRLTVYRPSQQKSLDVTITLTDAHDLEGPDPAVQQQQQQQNNYPNNNYNEYFDPFQYFFGY